LTGFGTISCVAILFRENTNHDLVGCFTAQSYSGQRRLASWLGQPFPAHAHFVGRTPPPVVPLWDPQPIVKFVGHDSNLQRTEKGVYGEELRNPLVLHCNFAYSDGGL